MASKKSHSRTQNKLSRREFAGLAAGGVLLSGSGASTSAAAATTDAAKGAKLAPLDIAEWSFFWVGVERATLPGGTSPVVSGKQMYVEYQVPAKVKHPYPIVLIHGGGGSGSGLDGHAGWPQRLVHDAAGRRLSSVRGRPAGSRPLAVSSRSARRHPSRADARKHFQPVHAAARQNAGTRRRAAGRQCQAPQSMAGHGRGRIAGAVPVGRLAGRVVRQRHGHHQGIAGAGLAEERRGAAG